MEVLYVRHNSYVNHVNVKITRAEAEVYCVTEGDVGNRGPSFQLVLRYLTTGQVIRSRLCVPVSNLRKFST